MYFCIRQLFQIVHGILGSPKHLWRVAWYTCPGISGLACRTRILQVHTSGRRETQSSTRTGTTLTQVTAAHLVLVVFSTVNQFHFGS